MRFIKLFNTHHIYKFKSDSRLIYKSEVSFKENFVIFIINYLLYEWVDSVLRENNITCVKLYISTHYLHVLIDGKEYNFEIHNYYSTWVLMHLSIPTYNLSFIYIYHTWHYHSTYHKRDIAMLNMCERIIVLGL